MSDAGKANLMISALMALVTAAVAHALGAHVWWMWGLAVGLLACVGLAAVQVGSISEH